MARVLGKSPLTFFFTQILLPYFLVMNSSFISRFRSISSNTFSIIDLRSNAKQIKFYVDMNQRLQMTSFDSYNQQ